MKYYLMLCLVFMLSANDKKVNSKPTNPGEIKIENKMTIMDDEGFYQRIISTVSPNGDYIIYDDGNKQMFIFDSKGNIKTAFGKEGNGPGEFNRVRNILANEDYIYVRSGRKYMILKYDGSLVKEISEHLSFGGDAILFKDRLSMFYTSSKFQKFSRVDYSLEGNTLKTYANKNYDAQDQTRRRRMNPDRIKARFAAARGLTKIEGGFARFYSGEYRYEKLDENLKPLFSVRRDYKRLIEKEDPEWMNRWKQRAGNNKQAQERRARFVQMRNQLTGGYLSDITRVLGAVNGYLFVQTSTEDKNTVKIDVFTNKDELYDQLEIKGDEVLSARIENSKLLINYKNEEDGPYLVSYDINAGQDHLVKK